MEEKVDSMFSGHGSMPQTLDPAKRLERHKLDAMPLNRVPPPRPSPDRSPSPNARHVSFPRRLERGPTPSSPHRNLSPSRSALSTRAAKQDTRAEEQLLAEVRSSTDGRPPNYHWQGSNGSNSNGSDSKAYPELPDSFNRPNLRSMLSETPGDAHSARSSSSSNVSPTLLEITDEEMRDSEVCRRIHDLRNIVLTFAREFANGPLQSYIRPHGLTSRLCRNAENAHLIRYIGCLAHGGPSGVEDWDNLLAGSETMTALVIGIISAVLKEHVFSALWLGGTAEQIEELEMLEHRQRMNDGYQRTKSRAARCVRFYEEAAYRLEDYETAKLRVKIALEKLLSPLYSLKQAYHFHLPDAFLSELSDIVDIASDLSCEMRLCADVIYYWPPTFKDEEFDQNRMECLNLESMINTSPYSREVTYGYEKTVLVGSPEESEAIVKIVAFPGLVAHRQGGGEEAQRQIQEDGIQRPDSTKPQHVWEAQHTREGGSLSGDGGFRTRVLCKSVVHLIWGRQRLLTRDAGTSTYLDAVRNGKTDRYDVDREGFVELYDCFLKHNARAVASI